jgi:hypothetical protein
MIMNIVPRHVARLAAIGALAVACPQLASASDSTGRATFELAMGPMSAAQKNQGTPATSDDAVAKPQHRTKHRHTHHAM